MFVCRQTIRYAAGSEGLPCTQGPWGAGAGRGSKRWSKWHAGVGAGAGKVRRRWPWSRWHAEVGSRNVVHGACAVAVAGKAKGGADRAANGVVECCVGDAVGSVMARDVGDGDSGAAACTCGRGGEVRYW